MPDAHASTYDRLKTRLKARLVEALAEEPRGRPRPDRQALEDTLKQSLRFVVQDAHVPALAAEDEARLVRDVLDEVVGLGPLNQLLSDPTITEIMINGPSGIFVERQGTLSRVDAAFRDTNHLMAVIERLLSPVGRTVNESEPICDATLEDGSRINVIIAPLVVNGPVVTIRRQMRAWTMKDYVGSLALSDQAAQFLEACVKAKVNCVVSGGTSTGKTTVVTILSSFIPSHERIITIENTPELTLNDREQWIQLISKSSNLEGRGEIPLRTLVRNALRMRPDRIILGEARGGEALDVVQAMHTGHDGVITVLHANSSQAALERLETLMLMSEVELPPQACRAQIAGVVDLVIHMSRFADGSRRVSAITQVLGASPEGFQLEDLFVFKVTRFSNGGKLEGECRYTGARPKFLHKFQMNNVPIPAGITT